MAVLDRITEMKKRGLSTGQILQTLKEQGISPREINEALSQYEIKSEVAGDVEDFPAQNPEPELETPAVKNIVGSEDFGGMQPSISSETAQTTQQIPAPEYQEYTPEQPSSQYQEYGEYQPYGYQEYLPPQSTDIETINDLASGIIEEKTKHIKKELSALSKSKNEVEEKINNLDKRLTKIENILENLQNSIIRKIGDYGDDIKKISKEMAVQRESFSKILDPLTDNIRELQKITGFSTEHESKHKTETQETRHTLSAPSKTRGKTKEKESRIKTKTSPSFEDYLR